VHALERKDQTNPPHQNPTAKNPKKQNQKIKIKKKPKRSNSPKAKKPKTTKTLRPPHPKKPKSQKAKNRKSQKAKKPQNHKNHKTTKTTKPQKPQNHKNHKTTKTTKPQKTKSDQACGCASVEPEHLANQKTKKIQTNQTQKTANARFTPQQAEDSLANRCVHSSHFPVRTEVPPAVPFWERFLDSGPTSHYEFPLPKRAPLPFQVFHEPFPYPSSSYFL
jgi:hypothetical protein